MQAQRALLNFTESEKKLGDRLLAIALEIDRIEGYSEPHAVVMAVMAEKMALRLGIHGSDLTALKFAALAHDLGERSMKRNYLLRPDALTWEETLDLWRHPILGEQAASEIGLPRHSQLLIRWHHESWNGFGYPDSLMGESIPIGARILRLVDTWYALRSNRPHRRPFDEDEATGIIADRAGLDFDPSLVRLFLAMRREERVVPREEPEVIIPDVDTFTILTPEGLQTAVVPHQTEADGFRHSAEHPSETSEPEVNIPVIRPADTSRLIETEEVTESVEPNAPPSEPVEEFLAPSEPNAAGTATESPAAPPEKSES